MGMPVQATTEEASVASEEQCTVDDLLLAARYGDLDEVMLMHSQLPGNSHNAQGCTALHMASANGHLDVVQYLLANGAEVNASNSDKNTPLHWAALNGQLSVVRELISKGANAFFLNNFDRSPLDEALSRGHVAVVEAISAGIAEAADISEDGE